MNTITRRTALAASVTLPLLPVSAYATPADPAVEAYRIWRAAEGAFEESMNRPDWPEDCPIVKGAHVREMAARRVLSDTVATTPAGLAWQVRFAFGVFGDLRSSERNIDNTDDYVFSGWTDNLEGQLLRSMLAGAEGMAGA